MSRAVAMRGLLSSTARKRLVQVPDRKIVHVILDNYAANKHPKVRQWLDRHPRFTFHFTPSSCSWLNAVEGFDQGWSRRRSG